MARADERRCDERPIADFADFADFTEFAPGGAVAARDGRVVLRVPFRMMDVRAE